MDRRHDPARRLPGSYPFFHELNSQFRDMDVNGHVNNVVLAAYYEDARVHFFVHLWGGRRANTDGDAYVMVANSDIDYLGEVRHPRTYRVGVGVAKIGTSSVVVSQALFEGDTCLGLADFTIVNVVGARPAPIAEERRRALADSLLPFATAPS